ncbi:MAG TPA: ABC transporter permease [Gemmatimonadales bacterium]|nr:ABC transporter permease [Gemmatimonadales bacterium]
MLTDLRHRLRALFRRDALERELDDELRFHLEQETEKLRREGLSAVEAARQARIALGIEATKEAARDARGVAAFEHLARDARYALRAVRRNPGFACMAVLTLALGIGANTAIFSVVNAVLLRPLPYPDADRLVTISSSVSGMPGDGGSSAMALSYPDYQDIGKLTDVLTGAAAWSTDHYNFSSAAEPRELEVARTTAPLFPVLGVAPVIGRTFSVAEMHDPVAVISHGLWLGNFNGDSTALGRTITLDQKSFTIVGVMPAGFAFPGPATDVWIPVGWAMTDAPEMAEVREYRAFSTVARLTPEASLDGLRRALDLLGKQITASGEATSKFGSGESFTANLLRDQIVGNARQPLLILFGAVALVLLIACVNAANLLLARANAREREFAVRRAIGAGRRTIIRQLLVESLLLALAAALVGILLAAAGLRLISAQLPHGYAAGIDGTVLAFTLLLAILTGLGFGIVPALRASDPALEQALRDGSSGTAGRPRRRARSILIVSEVALALVLLVSSALLVRSFVSLNAINPGFDPEGLLAARIRLTPARYATTAQQHAFFADLIERLRTQPGVAAATVADGPPLSGGVISVGMRPRQFRPDDPDQVLIVNETHVGPDFFSTMHIPVIEGRAITVEDRDGSKPVCVINQALAHELWPDQDPIGKTGLGRHGDQTVVGVVANVRSQALERAGGPAIYTPLAQSDRDIDEMWVMVRSDHPLGAIPALRGAVRAEDPSQPIASISTYDAIVQAQYAGLRLITGLISLFAGLALVLAVIGIGGVTAYAVSQRTRELGIRIAMGARAGDVIGLLLNETVILVAIGLGIGLTAAFGVTRALRSLLFGVTSTDLVTFAGAAIVLGLVALLATLIPARRAALVDPVIALRQE